MAEASGLEPRFEAEKQAGHGLVQIMAMMMDAESLAATCASRWGETSLMGQNASACSHVRGKVRTLHDMHIIAEPYVQLPLKLTITSKFHTMCYCRCCGNHPENVKSLKIQYSGTKPIQADLSKKTHPNPIQ